MKISIIFKYFPAGGKFMLCQGQKTKYYVRYNSKGSVWVEGNRTIDWRLPKFLWERL